MDEWRAVSEIGMPENINPTYGLMSGSGQSLITVANEYNQWCEQRWLDYDTAFAIFNEHPGMLGGQAWYHWVGVRGTRANSISIANSAPGYRDVWDELTREQYNSLGPFSAIWVFDQGAAF